MSKKLSPQQKAAITRKKNAEAARLGELDKAKKLVEAIDLENELEAVEAVEAVEAEVEAREKLFVVSVNYKGNKFVKLIGSEKELEELCNGVNIKGVYCEEVTLVKELNVINLKGFVKRFLVLNEPFELANGWISEHWVRRSRVYDKLFEIERLD